MWKEICQSWTYCQSGKKSLAEQNLFDEKLAFGEDEEWNLRLLSNPIRAGIAKNYGTIIFSGEIQLYTDFGMIL